MKMIAVIGERQGEEARKILEHCGFWQGNQLLLCSISALTGAGIGCYIALGRLGDSLRGL